MHWFFYHRMFSGHKYESYSIYDTIWCFPVICFKYIYKECDDVSKDMMIKVKKISGSLSLCDIVLVGVVQYCMATLYFQNWFL